MAKTKEAAEPTTNNPPPFSILAIINQVQSECAADAEKSAQVKDHYDVALMHLALLDGAIKTLRDAEAVSK